MKKRRIPFLKEYKEKKEKIACITAYDASMAFQAEHAEIDLILVGDSLGMVIQGHKNTVPVTIDDMIYHCSAVARGCHYPLIVADLPFMSYTHEKLALANVTRLMQAGAEMIKIEGGEAIIPIIKTLVNQGVPICGHLGLQPQFIHKRGGYKRLPNTEEIETFLITEANLLVDAGIDCLLVECIPPQMAKNLSDNLPIPVIGIGSGPDCDGQILVFHDVIGLSQQSPSFSKNFLLGQENGIQGALMSYVNEVKKSHFQVVK